MSLCACGCGKDAGVYTHTRIYKGKRQIKGEPREFIKGHYPRRGRSRHNIPVRKDAPPCDPHTLIGPVCLAVDCRAPMHRQRAQDAPTPRKCRKGHRAHGGRGLCDACRKRQYVVLGPVEQPALTDDEMLDEWDRSLRGEVAWKFAHERLGVSHEKWRAAYRRAEKAGDPRARRIWRDIPERELAIQERAELGLTDKGRGSACSREAS